MPARYGVGSSGRPGMIGPMRLIPYCPVTGVGIGSGGFGETGRTVTIVSTATRLALRGLPWRARRASRRWWFGGQQQCAARPMCVRNQECTRAANLHTAWVLLGILNLSFNQRRAAGSQGDCQHKLEQATDGAAHRVNLTAGNLLAGGERLPLGRPGERPQGFGTQTGLPKCARICEKPRRTRAGVRRSTGREGCQGKRTSATRSRAKRRCAKARSKSQVQRSAAAGERSLGVVQRSVCLKKRKVCSRENRAV
jgi:hypothetical protein